MPEPRSPLENAVASYDRATDKEFTAAAERERKEVFERFPLDQWPTMPLERYALGQKESRTPSPAGWNFARSTLAVCGVALRASTSSTNTRTNPAGTSTRVQRRAGGVAQSP